MSIHGRVKAELRELAAKHHGHGHCHHGEHGHGHGWFRGHRRGREDAMGPFGVRRPIRFLTRQLDLDDDQVTRLAAVLDDLKTERAQAAVDDRRAQKLFVEALTGDEFDKSKAEAAAAQRVEAAKNVEAAAIGALAALHEILDPEQRERLAYLVRSGTLTF